MTVVGVSADSGTIVNNGDGTWSFTPDADFNGTVELTYQVSDGTNTISVPGSVNVTPLNDAPVALSGALVVAEDVAHSGQLSASDVDGDVLSYSLSTGPSNGTVVVDGDGSCGAEPHLGQPGHHAGRRPLLLRHSARAAHWRTAGDTDPRRSCRYRCPVR